MWWRAKFGGKRYRVTVVRIRNRKDCCGQRLARTRVEIGGELCGTLPGKTRNNQWYTITCSKPVEGDDVKLITVQNTYLSIQGI